MRARGPSNEERLALDFITVTATGAAINAPCFIYAVDWTVTDSSVSALFSLTDSTSTADMFKDTARWDMKLGMTVASGATDVHDNFSWNANGGPPIAIQNGLYWCLSTGVRSVSVSYLAAS